MKKIETTTKFNKDLKRIVKQRKDISLIKKILETLQKDEPLPVKNRDHKLTGNYNGYRECHITPDWLLIYRIMEETISLERTGSHSDLFKL
jgi:mRNA interferase YafQ